MTNIYEIFKKFGITMPEDKKEEFDRMLAENYKTVNEVNNLKTTLEQAKQDAETYKNKYDADIQQRDADIKDLQTKLNAAGTDSEKLQSLQKDFETLQSTYDTAKTDYEKQLAKQAYEFAVQRKVSEIKFSSNSAKKAFIADALKEEMKLKDGELQGFDGFLESYKKSDAGAFVTENKDDPKPDDTPKPQFASKSTGKDPEPQPKPEKQERPRIW